MLQNEHGQWQYKVKLSEDIAKATNPGIQQVRRSSKEDEFLTDVIYDELLSTDQPGEDLLVEVFRRGERVYDGPALDEVRQRTFEQLGRLPETVKRLVEAEAYPVELDEQLARVKRQLIAAAKG